MTKTYDTRSRDDLLSAAHFAPYIGAPRLPEIGLRELRTLDRFFGFAATRGIAVPEVADFLDFVADDTSPRQLENLRTAFDRLLPKGTPVLRTIRDAIRTKRRRSRICDWRDRETLAGEPLMAPYRDLPGFARVAIEDLRVFVRFLEFAEAHGVTVPSVDDYVEFSSEVSSSRRLRSLKNAIDTLMPGNPAAQIILAEAIDRKSSRRPSRTGTTPRPTPIRRVPLAELPEHWRAVLSRWRTGTVGLHERVPAPSVIDNTEEVLCEYAKVQRDAGAEVAISIEGLRRMEVSRAAYAGAREDPSYEQQGNRPATRHTAVMRLRRFAEDLGLDQLTLDAIRMHENALRANLASVVPLKFGRFEMLPDLKETWALAHDLLDESARASRRQTRLRLRNEAFCIAFWTLIPLRLGDGQLQWGRDVAFDGLRYRIDIDTGKEDEPLRGRLHPALQPFLDALVLRGIDPVHLEHLREWARLDEVPLLQDARGTRLSRGYPSSVWRKHMGTGAHIARTRVHTELGQLGPEGVEMALALAAQRDPRTRKHYQAKAVAKAQRAQGQDMIDGLLAETVGEK